LNKVLDSDSKDISRVQLFTHELNTFLLKIVPLNPLGQWEQTTPKSTPSSHVDSHSAHQCLSPLHSMCQTTARSVHALPHNYATKAPLVTVEHPIFTPKLLLPFWW